LYTIGGATMIFFPRIKYSQFIVNAVGIFVLVTERQMIAFCQSLRMAS